MTRIYSVTVLEAKSPKSSGQQVCAFPEGCREESFLASPQLRWLQHALTCSQLHSSNVSVMCLLCTRTVRDVPSHVIQKIETFPEEIQDTRNAVHRTTMAQSPSKQVPWGPTQFSLLPSAAPLYFSQSQSGSEIGPLSKLILVLEKARSHRVPNLGCMGAEVTLLQI